MKLIESTCTFDSEEGMYWVQQIIDWMLPNMEDRVGEGDEEVDDSAFIFDDPLREEWIGLGVGCFKKKKLHCN